MSHMEKQIEFRTMILVDGNAGITAIPADLVSIPKWMAEDVSFDAEIENRFRWLNFTQFAEFRDFVDSLRQYCESTELATIEIKTGWYCRLSAPGYLDCTEWSGPYASARFASESLDNFTDGDGHYVGEEIDPESIFGQDDSTYDNFKANE